MWPTQNPGRILFGLGRLREPTNMRGFLLLSAVPAALAAHGHSHDHAHEDHGHAHSHGEAAAVETAVSHSFLGGFVPFPVVAMITLLFLKIGFGLAPRFFRHNARLLSLANAFSAGIFLAGGLAHLLPEAAHAFQHVPVRAGYPQVQTSGSQPLLRARWMQSLQVSVGRRGWTAGLWRPRFHPFTDFDRSKLAYAYQGGIVSTRITSR